MTAGRSIEFLTRGTPILWALVAVLRADGGAVLLRRCAEGTLLLSLVVTCAALSLLVVRDNTARPLYYLLIPLVGAYPAFYAWTAARELPRLDPQVARPVAVGLAAFLLVSSGTMVGLSVGRVSLAVDFYYATEGPRLEGLDWLRANTPPDAVVATAGLPFDVQPEGTRFGWWIEGYAERKSLFAGSPIYASCLEERQRVAAANRFFTGN